MKTLEKNPAGFPDGLPLLPELKEGFTYEYHPHGWMNKGNPSEYYAHEMGKWWYCKKIPSGFAGHYAELVPAKPAVRRFKLPKKGYTYDFAEFRGSQVFWVMENGNELRSNLKAEEVPSMIGFDKWIELPAETEPDYWSEDYQAMVRKAWAENPKVDRDVAASVNGPWIPMVKGDWIEGCFYRLRPKPKRIPLSEYCTVFVEWDATAKMVKFCEEDGTNKPIIYLHPDDLPILSRLVSEPKGGAL